MTWNISLANVLSNDRGVASNLVIDPGLSNHGDKDMVCLAYDIDSLAGDFTENSDT